MKSLLMAASSLILVMAGMAGAVETVYVVHDSEKQFKEGEPNDVLISSEGEISLAYETEKLLSDSNDVWVVNALAEGVDGSVYAASSGAGYVYRLRAGQPPEIIYGKQEGDVKHVFSLAIDQQGRLLAGTGGEAGKLIRFDGQGNRQVIFEDESVGYIWSMVVGPAGRLYLGTGPQGKVFTLDSEAKNPELLYKATEKNILTLALDDGGILYAGGDEHGLVYRIDPGSKQVTIVYDTEHSEVSSLVFDEAGNLYAATADASAARPGVKLILSDGVSGRPAGGPKPQSDSKAPSSEKDSPKPAEDKRGDNSEAKELEEDEEDGPMEMPAGGPPAPGGPGRMMPVPGKRRPAKENDVYKISPDGYVVKIFSKPVVILALAYTSEGGLLLATGNDGQLLRLNADEQRAVVLYESSESVQVSSVLVGRTGTVYAGMANPGAVLAFKSGYAGQGEYVSGVIDAEQVSRWGKLQIESEVPQGARLTVSTRTGNTSEPDKGGWQGWTEAVPAEVEVAVASPPGRFLRYRLGFVPGDNRGTPVVKKVKLAHSIPNLPPKVEDLQVGMGNEPPEGASEQKPVLTREIPIRWKATDANKDPLEFEIYIRLADHSRWVRIAKELSKPLHKWDIQTVADGRYEVKVVASDKPGNPAGQELTDSRMSKVVVVDNTPPEVRELSYTLAGRKVSFQATAVDALSAIGAVSYCVNSAEKWQKVMPADGVYDSLQESMTFSFEADETGEHLVAVRFGDVSGNVTYRNVSVVVP